MRLKSWLGPALAATACAVAFWPATGHAFLDWDDLGNFTYNPYWAHPTWRSVIWAFGRFHSSHYHPLTWLSLLADRALGGPGPRAVHLVNVLLHAASAAMLCAVSRELYRERAASATALETAAASAGLLWGLHPLRVEAVAWASERREVLGGLFLLMSVYAYLLGRRRLSLAACAASLLSKAMGMTLPLLLVLLDAARGRQRPWRAQLKEKAPFAAACALACAAALIGERANGSLGSLAAYPLSARLGVCAYNVCFLLRKTLWPTALQPLYPWPQALAERGAAFALSAAAAATLMAAALAGRRRAPAAAAAGLWFVTALLPVSGLVRFGPQLSADRFSYVPALSLAALAGAALSRLAGRKLLAAAGAAALICLALGRLTRAQTLVWRDTETLFRYALAANPALCAGQLHLGNALQAQGRRQEALSRYRAAAACDPGYAAARNNLGNALSALGKQGEAIEQLRAADRLSPGHAVVHYNIGRALELEGRQEEARREYELELERDAGSVPAREALRRLSRRP